MKLISMTDFVLSISKQTTNEGNSLVRNFNKIKNYATFLKQPLKLEMFVPCVNGEPLPVFYSTKWYKAKEKVLFKGFTLSEKKLSVQSFRENGNLRMQIPIKDILSFDTVEDMANHFIEPLELTEQAAKKYYNHD